jgi:hypothetical protein
MPEVRDRIRRIIGKLTGRGALTTFIRKLTRLGSPRCSDPAGAERIPLMRIEPRTLPQRRSGLTGQSRSKD